MANVTDALMALNIDEWSLSGDPTSEAEFNAQFKKVTGTDENGSGIISSNPSDFGTTWSAVSAKVTELTNAEPMVELRKQRDGLLSDVTMADDMASYRQSLRDLPSGASPTLTDGVLGNVTFPTKPS